MKWIGQHIVDLIARFRGDVYLEDIGTGTIANGGNLGLDSNNKIVKAADPLSGDLTGIDAGTGLSGVDLNGPIPRLNVDASQTQITAVGTIGTGVWNGTEIASAYLDADTAHLSVDQTFTGTKTFGKPITSDGNRTMAFGDGAAIHVDAFDVTDGTTSASGTTTSFNHVGIEAPRLLATNSSVTTTNASTLYIKGPPVASTNQTITNAYSLLVDSGDVKIDQDLIVNGDIDLEGDIDVNGTLETDALTIGGAAVLAQATASAVGAVELATTAEADTGTDTARAVTPAGLKSHVDARYAYQYIMFHASDVIKSNWITFGTNGLTNHTWGTDTSDSGVTVGSSTIACDKNLQAAGFKIPFACKLIGFYGTGHRYGSNSSFSAGVFILDSPDYNSAASGGAVDILNATLRAYAAAEDGGVSSPFNQKLNKVVDTSRSYTCPAGSMIFPAFKDTAGVNSGSFRGNMTIILATPIVTIA